MLDTFDDRIGSRISLLLRTSIVETSTICRLEILWGLFLAIVGDLLESFKGRRLILCEGDDSVEAAPFIVGSTP